MSRRMRFYVVQWALFTEALAANDLTHDIKSMDCMAMLRVCGLAFIIAITVTIGSWRSK